MDLDFDPAIPFLEVFPTDLLVRVQNHFCRSMGEWLQELLGQP